MLDFVLKEKNFKNYKSYLLVVYILWACSLLLYYFLSNYINSGSLINGVKFGNDSTFYLKGAKNIINGDISKLIDELQLFQNTEKLKEAGEVF